MWNTATIGAAALATIDWSEAEILMQSRPATDNLIEAKYIQFPGFNNILVRGEYYG